MLLRLLKYTEKSQLILRVLFSKFRLEMLKMTWFLASKLKIEEKVKLPNPNDSYLIIKAKFK